VPAAAIEAASANGIVTLTGSVDNLLAKETVGSLLQSRMATSAAFEAGADWVENRLELRAGS
jgi:hypothetical protein